MDRVELIETHISWVFLAGERIYKVKKPVDLGFLDFTTLETIRVDTSPVPTRSSRRRCGR